MRGFVSDRAKVAPLVATLVPALAVALAVALAACGPTPLATSAPSPSEAAPAAVTAAPTVTSTPPSSTPSGPAAAELPGDASVDLAPGRYTRAGFAPRLTFEVGTGWRAVQVQQGFFDIQQDVGSPDVIAVQFARPDGLYGAGGDLVESTTAEAAAATIQANPALTILDASESRMSGLDGFVIEAENPASASGPAQVLSVPPGALSIDPARRLWIAVFDTPDGIVAILVGGSIAKWDEALAAAEPVLETVTIGQ